MALAELLYSAMPVSYTHLLGGSYMAEAFRSGLEAIEPIQTESALSLGMSRLQTMHYVEMCIRDSHNGDAVQLQPDADDLQEEGNGGLKAVVLLEQFKGGGDQVEM